MKREVIISYNWSADDGREIKFTHQEALEESAMDRIIKMMKDGYTSGELFDNISMDEEDGEEGVEYSGWWSVTTKNTDEDTD